MLISHRKEVLQALSQAKENAVRQCGQMAEAFAKELCPVDTGALRDSIHYTVNEDSFTLSADAPYAAYVELGTHKPAAQPFLRPALENHVGELTEAIREALEG